MHPNVVINLLVSGQPNELRKRLGLLEFIKCMISSCTGQLCEEQRSNWRMTNTSQFFTASQILDFIIFVSCHDWDWKPAFTSWMQNLNLVETEQSMAFCHFTWIVGDYESELFWIIIYLPGSCTHHQGESYKRKLNRLLQHIS